MSEKNQNKERKYQIRKGFELCRIKGEVADSMTEKDQKRMHITPTTKEIIFARDYLIKESQKMTHPEEYESLQHHKPISEKSPLIKLNP